MIFSSIQYLLFLPIAVLIYWRTTGGARTAFVVIASYFFYMSFLPIYGVLLFLFTLVNWCLGAAIEKALTNQSIKSNTQAKAILFVGLLLNLGCLCYYKYTNFILENIAGSTNWLHSLGLTNNVWTAPVLNIALPLGISFFVFEFIHYLVDIYGGNKSVRSFMEFTAFASFFPSQIAGPIKRYQDFEEKLKNPEPLSTSLFFEATALIVQGMFKKVAIADPIGELVVIPFTQMTSFSCADVLLASIGFALQIYCDFSGYTDIGRGSALLLGIRLPINFALPYLSIDVREFWRRWHISLSTWLRDYVYIPLGGNRVGRYMHWRNTMATMLICGLWHGASWHYVMFGGMHGVGIVVNSVWKNYLKEHQLLSSIWETRVGKAVSVVLTFVFATAAFAVFRAPDLPHLLNLIYCLKNVSQQCYLVSALEKVGLFQIMAVYFLFWFATDLAGKCERFLAPIRIRVPGNKLLFKPAVRFASWTAALLLILAAKPNVAVPFIYFQF